MITRQGKHGNHFHFADDIPSHVIVSGTLPFVRLPNFKAKKERRKPPHQKAVGTSGKGVIALQDFDLNQITIMNDSSL